MESWRKRSRRGTRPYLHQRQLSDPSRSIFIWVDRRVSPAGMGNRQTLEGKKFQFRSKVRGSKSWKTPVGAVAGINPKIRINQISNLLPNYILARVSILLFSSNYLIPYFWGGSTVLVGGAGYPWHFTGQWRRYSVTSINPDNDRLVPASCSYSSSVEYDVVTSENYCRGPRVGISVVS